MKRYTEKKASAVVNRILHDGLHSTRRELLCNVLPGDYDSIIATDGTRAVKLFSRPAGIEETRISFRDEGARILHAKNQNDLYNTMEKYFMTAHLNATQEVPSTLEEGEGMVVKKYCKLPTGHAFQRKYLQEAIQLFPTGKWFVNPAKKYDPLLVVAEQGYMLIMPVGI